MTLSGVAGSRAPKRRAWRLGTGLAIGLFATVGPAAGQSAVAARAEVAVLSQYQWRGIRRSDAPVLQPGALVGIRIHDPVWLSAGGWASFELREADGSRRSDLMTGHWGPAEESVWAGAEIARPGWSARAAVTRSWYTRPGSDAASTESTVRLERVGPVIAPRVEVWHDHGGGRGTYIEAALSRIIASPLERLDFNLVVTGLTGYAAGVVDTTRLRRGLPGFTRSGFTHSMLSIAIRAAPRIAGMEVTLELTPELELSYDPSARAWHAGEPPGGHFFRGWVFTSIGLAWPGRRRE